jgi:DNA polymerase elongation subunit (family B)
LNSKVRSLKKSDDFINANTIESIFEKIAIEFDNKYEDDENTVKENSDDNVTNYDEADYNYNNFKPIIKEYSDKKATIVDILLDKKYEREGKLNELNISLNSIFPKLEGDKVTFIGSTIMNYGNKDPHYNHCIVLDTCADIPNCVIESYETEKDVLLAWQQFVQRENPDIIIGYNIFGFDYEFMFRRAEENDCTEEFLKLSRNKDEICGTRDKDTNKWKIEESTLQIASGQHDLRYIKMNGRTQVDLYNFYRRGENLTSYKLDYVGGYMIGDIIKSIDLTNIESTLDWIDLYNNTINQALEANENLDIELLNKFIYIPLDPKTYYLDEWDNWSNFLGKELKNTSGIEINKNNSSSTTNALNNLTNLINNDKDKIKKIIALEWQSYKDIKLNITPIKDYINSFFGIKCLIDIRYRVTKTFFYQSFILNIKISSLPEYKILATLDTNYKLKYDKIIYDLTNIGNKDINRDQEHYINNPELRNIIDNIKLELKEYIDDYRNFSIIS